MKANRYHMRDILYLTSHKSIKKTSEIAEHFQGHNSHQNNYRDALADLMPKEKGEWREKPMIRDKDGIQTTKKEEYVIFKHPNVMNFIKTNEQNTFKMGMADNINPHLIKPVDRSIAIQTLSIKTEDGKTYLEQFESKRLEVELILNSKGVSKELIRKALKKVKRKFKRNSVEIT